MRHQRRKELLVRDYPSLSCWQKNYLLIKILILKKSNPFSVCLSTIGSVHNNKLSLTGSVSRE